MRRYLFIYILLTLFLASVRGQGTAGSSIVSKTALTADTTRMLVQRVYDNGLDTYDYGARQYYPILGRWDRMDPLCEKYYSISPYVYCLNNPIKFIDINGLAPGDYFKTKNDAAKDFGRYYNPLSIKQGIEFASYIMYNPQKKKYYYPEAISGTGNKIKGFIKTIKRHQKVATIHTHGAYDENYISNGIDWNDEFYGMENTPQDNKNHKPQDTYDDISSANKNGLDSYVVTPNGNLKKYNPLTGEITIISNQMPSDKKAGKRQANNNSVENKKTAYRHFGLG